MFFQQISAHDEKPVSGVGSKKSFEEMIEEQMRQEQEKVCHEGS